MIVIAHSANNPAVSVQLYPAALTKRLPPAPPSGGAGASKENPAGKVNIRKTTLA
ncbi:MAG: hypothetical protein M9932_19575 [Xanthobacteraceae bacterium]|nr:hypothetical protein [Xanthobacteraceae bacterium]